MRPSLQSQRQRIGTPRWAHAYDVLCGYAERRGLRYLRECMSCLRVETPGSWK